MTKQEEKLFQKAKSHITQLCKIANEFEKLNLPFSISISNRFVKNQAQTTVECLREMLEMGYKLDQKQWFDYICNKIKELEE